MFLGGMPVNLIGAMQQMRISPNQQQPMMMMNPAGLVPGQIMYYEGSMNPYRSVYQTGMEAAKDFVGGSSSVWIGTFEYFKNAFFSSQNL